MSRPALSTVQQQQNRGFWLRTLHQWHWISSAVCLIGMLLFAVTGLTLNHAAKIEAKPECRTSIWNCRPRCWASWARARTATRRFRARPGTGWTRSWASPSVAARPSGRPRRSTCRCRAGGDAWLSIDRETGAVEYESTSRGVVSYLNDLHKGRNAGPAWGWFLDLFAVACLVFCITGLFLLHLHARQRRMTWPLVGLGLMIPLLIALLLIH